MTCVLISCARWRLPLDRCLGTGLGPCGTQRTDFHGTLPSEGGIAHIEQHDMAAAGLKYQRFMGCDLYRHQLHHAPLVAFCNHIVHLCLTAHRATDCPEISTVSLPWFMSLP